MRGPASDGYRTGSTRVRASDATDVDHLQSWVAARRGVEGFVEPRTAVSDVTLLLVALSGLASGLETTLIRSASTLMSGHVNVGGFFKPTRSQVAPVLTGVSGLRAQVHTTLPDAEIVDRMRGWARLISGRASFFVALAGVDIVEEKRLREVLQVAEGDLAGLEAPSTVALFMRQAKRLEVGIGDVLTLSAPTLGGAENTAAATGRVVQVRLSRQTTA